MSVTTAVTIGRMRGWLHHADGARGVVMCAALGYEALCAHHAWRALGEQLSAAGLPTLRFDYPGAGDSLDDETDAEFRARWRASIADAVAWMRETLGMREIVLVGFRLGASLAAEVGGVDRLVQIAPVLKGDAYLRELRVMSRMLAASGQCPREKSASEDNIDLEGFVIDAAMIAEIKAIDAARLDAAPAPKILLLPEPGARGADAYRAQLSQLGASVETRPLENYAALAPAPTPAAPPKADFDAIVAWARDGAETMRAATPVSAPALLESDGFTEQAIRFGENDALAGILCMPAQSARAPCVIMLNTGANAHIGCGRSFVEIARALATQGAASLRMDFLGVGESQAIDGGPGAMLYRAARRADISAAIDCLAARGQESITLFGVCSGATLALFAAAADSRVDRVLLGNIQIFNDLKTDEAIEARLARAYASTSTYVAKATDREAWARVFRGEVKPRQLVRIAATLARRKSAALAKRLGHLPDDAREALRLFEAVSRRGARCVVLHGDHDVGLEEMRTLFGADAARLRALPGVELKTVAESDHVFSSTGAQKHMIEELTALLDGAGAADRELSLGDASAPEAVICIPTFRRPEMLASTLASIEAQRTRFSYAVVVIDNDRMAQEGLAVARRFFDEGRLNGVAGVEAQQGNVHAINAAFGLARATYPQANYFLMIDDDEIAAPNWLDDMVGAARREKADIVGGPVIPLFPEGARPAFHDHPVYWPLYIKSGPVPMIFGTGNCLIARRVFEGLPSSSLDMRFNFLGGGDTEFFTRCRKAGFSFYWSQEAHIREQVTPNRLSFKWVMRRSIATGVINYRIDRLGAQNTSARVVLLAKNVAIVPVALHRALRVLVRRKHPLTALHPIAVAAGRWLALLGLDPQPYRHPTS